jgi:predicted nucleic acid-binding protein
LTVVVDASIVVPAAITGTWSQWLADDDLRAPTLMWSEAAATLRQMEWRSEVSSVIVRSAMEWLANTAVTAVPSRDLVVAAHNLASRLGWAKTYDAEYIVLAQRLGVPFATLDGRLRRSGVQDIVRLWEPPA